MMKKRFKNNVVYSLLIDGIFYYVGCHTRNSDFIHYSQIIKGSGNPVTWAYCKKQISIEDLNRRVILLEVIECTSKEEAEDLEASMIAEYKELYGDLCLNKCKGNKYGRLGLTHTEEAKKKIAEAKKVYNVLQYSKDGVLLNTFNSTMDAQRNTGIYQGSIVKCCNGLRQSAGGYIWKAIRV